MNKLVESKIMRFVLVYLALGLISGFAIGWTLNGARQTRIVHIQDKPKPLVLSSAQQIIQGLGKPTRISTPQTGVTEFDYSRATWGVKLFFVTGTAQ